MTEAVEFGLSEIAENHLPDWISGYACISYDNPEYKCPEGYKRTVYKIKELGSHGCCHTCFAYFVKCEQTKVVTFTSVPPNAPVRVTAV